MKKFIKVFVVLLMLASIISCSVVSTFACEKPEPVEYTNYYAVSCTKFAYFSWHASLYRDNVLLYPGESINIRQINGWGCHFTSRSYMTFGAVYNNGVLDVRYETITARKQGISLASAVTWKKLLFSYYRADKTNMLVMVIDKPTYTADATSITIGNTTRGVCYTINGVTKWACCDGQKLVFNELNPQTEYKCFVAAKLYCNYFIRVESVSTNLKVPYWNESGEGTKELSTTIKYEVVSDTVEDVGGLCDEAVVVKAENPNSNVKVVLDANKVEYIESVGQHNLSIADDGEKTFYDFTLTKYVGEADGEKIPESKNVIEIVVPFDTSYIAEINIYRYHDDETQKFTQCDSKNDLTYFIEGAGEDAKIHVFTQKFSDYVISTKWIPEYFRSAQYYAGYRCTVDAFIAKGYLVGIDLTANEIKSQITLKCNGKDIAFTTVTNGTALAYVFECEAKDISTDYSVEIYCDGILSRTVVQSAASYFQQLSTLYTDINRELALAILNYGAYAEQYLGGITDNLANEGYEINLDEWIVKYGGDVSQFTDTGLKGDYEKSKWIYKAVLTIYCK